MMEMIESAANSPLEYTETVNGIEDREARTRARTHTEIMSDLGFETPAPMPKHFRDAWSILLVFFLVHQSFNTDYGRLESNVCSRETAVFW